MEEEDILKFIATAGDDENDWKSKSQVLQWERFPLPSWPQSNNQPVTSNGLLPNQTNASTVPASQSPTISTSSRLVRNYSSLSETEKAMRKRKADQEYRKRSKYQRVEMQSQLEMLTGENESLKKENVSLKEHNSSMNQTLIDQAKEIDRLRSDLFQLKRENGKQNVLMQTLSELLADPVQLENKKLKDENAELRKNAYLNSDLTQLAEETAKLRVENKVLKVQNDALCGKIIIDNEKKHEQGTLN